MLYITLHVHLSCFTVFCLEAACSKQLFPIMQVKNLQEQPEHRRHWPLKNPWSPAFDPGSSLPGCLFCALDVNHSVKEIIVVCHECKAPYLNTDMDKAVCFFNSFFLSVRFYWSYSSIILGKEAYDNKACTWQSSAWNSSLIISMWSVNLCFDSSKGIHQQCACINSPVRVRKRMDARGEKS